MTWVDVHGNDIYYVERGQGQPLLFLHGNSSCSEAWWQQFDAFSDRYRCIAYDSVNHGHSSNSPRDAEEPDRADELEGFLAALGIERPVIAGNSMGGNTLIRWATRHPDQALALIPSGSGVAAPGQGMPPGRDPLDADTLFLPIGDSLTDGFKQAQPRMYERYLRIRSTATRLEAMRNPRRPSQKTVDERTSMADRVGAITSPMTIIVGGLDRAVEAAKRLNGLVEGSQYVEIEGAPHNVYYEAAEPYNAALSAFLARLPVAV
ncbi:MAG: alpha/beta fold hydrolase [Dehalococcoidia bacterium]|nr:alpha/beta fold hydrolase [Dehalococcoidia bacterium]